LEKLTHNVPGCKRRFCDYDKGIRSIAGANNVGEGGVGASEATDLADRNPGAAEWRRSVYRLLCAGLPYTILLYIIFSLLVF
jgi:hypothetical protein